MRTVSSGDVIADRFVIEQAAASGGMGDIYRAFDRVSDAVVAVKVLRAPGRRDPRACYARLSRTFACLAHGVPGPE